MRRYRWFSVGGFALVLAVLAAHRTPLPAAETAPALTDAVCRFIALRGVIEDLQGSSRDMQAEATYLERDASSLWHGWRSVFGVSQAFGPWSVAAPGAAVKEGSDEQRFQTEVFALYGRGLRTEERARGLTVKLRKADEAWWAISRRLAASDGEEVARSMAGIDALRSSMAQLAGEANALDEDVRRTQRALDRLYPRMLQLLRRDAPGAVAVPQPWHWTYMISGKPRPALRYDFDLRYDEELAAARRSLTERAALRSRLPPSGPWRSAAAPVPPLTVP